MDLKNIAQLDKNNYMNTFGARTQLCVSHGKGMFVYDTDGKEYMDLFAGIAVSALGHAHPDLVKTIANQAEKIIHCSNLYYNEPQTKLAEKLNNLAGGGHKVFFANSGAEANEAAIKLARAYFHKKDMPWKNEIITMKNSFHGRTLTTITATGQPKYQKYFSPLTPGFKYAEINNIESVENELSENTCAIMLEIIQGESGVHALEEEFLKAVRNICHLKNILLIVDEVQTGIGRTGDMFAYQGTGIEPDIFTLAKALGGGVPIGAACAKDFVAEAFAPGDHGTTFGGNPLACAAALAVLEVIERDGLLEKCKETGAHFSKKLNELVSAGLIGAVRASGLMIGFDLKNPSAPEVKNRLMELGFLVGNVGLNTVRVLPPLVAEKEHIDKFIEALKSLEGDLL